MQDVIETTPNKSDEHPAGQAIKTVLLSILAVIVVSNIATLALSFGAMAVYGPMTREELTYFTMPGKAITLILYWFKYRKRLTGFFDIKGLGMGLFLGAGMLAVNAVTLIGGVMDHMEWGNIPMAIWEGMQPGFSEEILYRIIPLSLAMKAGNREQAAAPAMIVTSVLFGFIHMFNMFYGADVLATVLQTVYAVGVGLVFSCIYLKTGNMWVSIILHSLTDIVYFMSAQGQSSGGVLSQRMGIMEVCVLLGYTAVYFANAYYVHRKTKPGEIEAVWARIWDSKAQNV